MGSGAVPVNWLAVIISTIASFIFGWIWYWPLFGKAWLKGAKMSEKQSKEIIF